MGITEHSETTIFYEFTFNDGVIWQHQVSLSDETEQSGSEAPPWTRLEFQQCSHCPLAAREKPHCPYAAILAGPIAGVGQRASFEAVDVWVKNRGREIRQRTSLQRALGSLLGLLGAVSGCPHTRMLRPMARFHWPFSSSHETLYRALGSYLLGQHLRAQRGLAADWSLEGLREIYRNLRLVNLGMSKRLRAAAEEDSGPNSVVLLDLLAADMEYLLDSYEGELDQYFPEFID
jgi:hypothetical protein